MTITNKQKVAFKKLVLDSVEINALVESASSTVLLK